MLLAVDIYGGQHKVELREITWRPSAYGIVLQKGRILLSPQHDLGFDLPGGGIGIGEKFEEGVKREVKEETGIEVMVKRFITMRDNLFIWDPNGPDRSVCRSILLYYLCEPIGGEISTIGFDDNEKEYAQEAQWMDLNTIDSWGIASTIDYRQIVKECISYGN